MKFYTHNLGCPPTGVSPETFAQRAVIADRISTNWNIYISNWLRSITSSERGVWCDMMCGNIAFDDKTLTSLCAHIKPDYAELVAPPTEAELTEIRFRHDARKRYSNNYKVNLKWLRSNARISMHIFGGEIGCSAVNIAHCENPKMKKYLSRANCLKLIRLAVEKYFVPQDSITPEDLLLPPEEFQAKVNAAQPA